MFKYTYDPIVMTGICSREFYNRFEKICTEAVPVDRIIDADYIPLNCNPSGNNYDDLNLLCNFYETLKRKMDERPLEIKTVRNLGYIALVVLHKIDEIADVIAENNCTRKLKWLRLNGETIHSKLI